MLLFSQKCIFSRIMLCLGCVDGTLEQDSDGGLEQEVDEIMTDIFGGYDTSAEQSNPESDSDIDIAITDTNVEFDN